MKTKHYKIRKEKITKKSYDYKKWYNYCFSF